MADFQAYTKLNGPTTKPIKLVIKIIVIPQNGWWAEDQMVKLLLTALSKELTNLKMKLNVSGGTHSAITVGLAGYSKGCG